MIRHKAYILCLLSGFVVLLCMAGRVEAETRLGFTGGLSFSRLSMDFYRITGGRTGSNIDDSYINRKTDYRTGFAVGFIVEFPMSDNFSLRSQYQIVQKGSPIQNIVLTSESFPDGYATGNFGRRSEYLSMPLMVRAALVRTSPATPYLLAGPRLDVKLDDSPDSLNLTPTGNSARYFVFGLSFGGGFERTLSNGKTLLVEAVYDWDLTDASNVELSSDRNQAILIRFGMLWD